MTTVRARSDRVVKFFQLEAFRVFPVKTQGAQSVRNTRCPGLTAKNVLCLIGPLVQHFVSEITKCFSVSLLPPLG